MDQKDMLDRIRHSAEHVEVPDQLSPQKIEERLKNKGQRKTIRRKRMIRWIEAAAVVALIAAGGSQAGLYKQTGEQAGTVTEEGLQKDRMEAIVEDTEETGSENHAEAGFRQAGSEEELYETLKKYRSETNGVYAKGMDGGVVTLDEGMAAQSTQDSSVAAQNGDFSQTNIREAGIEEGDVVKTDGNYLYVIKENSSLKMVDIRGEQMQLVCTIEPEQLNERIQEMYLDGEKLILVTSGSKGSMEEKDTDLYAVNRYVYTSICVYDISDRAHPQLTGKTTQEGYYRMSRKNGDNIYLLTQYTPTVMEKLDDSDVMPLVNEKKITVADIYLPSALNQSDYLVISGMNIREPDTVISSKAVVSGASDFYMSNENLYIYESSWNNGTESTQILKFSCEQGQISAQQMAEVPGYLNDTFSLDEYNGYLRVLTTEINDSESNSLFILDENMEIVSSMRDIAAGETLRSARFMGDAAYFVTFRQTDPLFCVDLSDPGQPQITGEQKISGFSSYLHPYGENRLLGIGFEADEETGNQTGVKLSMFDTSDPEQMTELDKYVIEDAAYLPFDYNYKAITIDAEKNLIGFVCDSEYLVFRYAEDGGFENILTYSMGDWISWDGADNCRGTYVGDRFYITDSEQVLCFDMSQDFALIGQLDL